MNSVFGVRGPLCIPNDARSERCGPLEMCLLFDDGKQCFVGLLARDPAATRGTPLSIVGIAAWSRRRRAGELEHTISPYRLPTKRSTLKVSWLRPCL